MTVPLSLCTPHGVRPELDKCSLLKSRISEASRIRLRVVIEASSDRVSRVIIYEPGWRQSFPRGIQSAGGNRESTFNGRSCTNMQDSRYANTGTCEPERRERQSASLWKETERADTEMSTEKGTTQSIRL